MVRTRHRDRSFGVPGPDKNTSRALAANSFMFSGWPRELPDSLDELQAKWYNKAVQANTTDVIESYGDDGADDWDDFAGNVTLYPEPGDLEKAIGSTFVNRAKRACRASKSWEQFVADEEAIDSMSMTKREFDPEKCKILLEECLNNDLRMDVFEQLKERLCTEIWREEYIPKGDVREEEHARAKKDSKVWEEASTIQAQEEAKNREPDGFSVVGWHGFHPIWHDIPKQASGPEQAAQEGEEELPS